MSKSSVDEKKMSDWLLDDMAGRFAWFYGAWHEYSAGVWRPKHEIEMRAFCLGTLVNTREKTWSDLKIGDVLLNRVLNLAKTQLFVPDAAVNAGQNYLNLRNGLVNLDTLALEEHRPDIYTTRQVDYDYDPRAVCPAFDAFLFKSLAHEDGTTDYQSCNLAWEAIAYTISPETNRKTAFFLVGPGDSGKSTLISIVASLLGELAKPFDFKVLQSESAYRFALSPLSGTRMIFCTEIESGAAIPDGIFKTLTGGDTISADVKNKAPISYRPEFKMWMATNNLPAIGDRSGATMNRISMLVFPRSFAKADQDLFLIDKTRAERAGILNSALKTLRMLRQRPTFTLPQRSAARLETYKLTNDPEALFVRECLTGGGETGARDLQDVYYAWRKKNGYPVKPWPRVVGDLERLGVQRKRTPPGNVYLTSITTQGWDYKV
jgi:putative DNA primase/helicase